jgi:hypothetical protein
MKNNIKTIIIFTLIAVLSYASYQMVTGKKASMSNEALSDFAIEDTASVNQIILSDTEGRTLKFVKNNNSWTYEDGSCIQQHLITSMLEAFKHLSVKSPVPVSALDNVNKMLTSHHKKVEIFQNGEWIKTWYIGNSTKDHDGTYMLLKDAEKGKSPEPFIMHLPNVYGVVDARFSTDSLSYLCTQIFAYNPKDIKSVEVEIPQSPELSFKIVNNNDVFSLFNNNQQVSNFDTVKVRQYLVGYKKIHFNAFNRTLSDKEVDSLKQSIPKTIITVTDKNGKINAIKTYLKGTDATQYDLEGNILVYDRDYLWVFTNEGILTKGQYYVFDKLLRDINYFLK